jgi:hypothetical protein
VFRYIESRGCLYSASPVDASYKYVNTAVPLNVYQSMASTGIHPIIVDCNQYELNARSAGFVDWCIKEQGEGGDACILTADTLYRDDDRAIPIIILCRGTSCTTARKVGLFRFRI